MKRLLESWLLSSRLPIHLAVLAVVLLLPALGSGWQLDDLYHRTILTGRGPVGMTPWQVFSGPPPDPAMHDELVELGVLPWWSSDGFRLSLFRPLSVLTMRVDYWLWPDSARLMHVHSLLWFAALVAAAALLYRRLMAPAWLAGLAALLYAIDDAHAGPAAWIANRNALIACLFGVLCLIAHDSWRRRGHRGAALLAPTCLAAALAGGEAALSTAGYLLAYAIFRETGSWRRRLVSLVPTGAILGAWAGIYRLGGYGAHGSGMYLDPLGDPIAYLRAVVARAPVALLGQWSPLPADLATLLPPERQLAFWCLAAGALVLLAALAWPLVRARPATHFWLLGSLLSLLPISAVFPSNRLLSFVGLGAMPLVAELMVSLWTGAPWLPDSTAWRRCARPAAVMLALTHLPLALVGMPLGALSIVQTGGPVDRAAATLPVDPAILGQELVLVNAPDYLLYVTHIPTYQLLAGRPAPARIRALSTGPTAISITRTGRRSLHVQIERGLFAGPLGLLFREATPGLPVGHAVALDGLTLTVLGVNERGEPDVVGYDFDTDLEDPSRRWFHFVDDGWRDFALPAVGETWRLEAPRGPLDFLY
jgi:hypothetical protein